jgi:hypothetical protein
MLSIFEPADGWGVAVEIDALDRIEDIFDRQHFVLSKSEWRNNTKQRECK